MDTREALRRRIEHVTKELLQFERTDAGTRNPQALQEELADLRERLHPEAAITPPGPSHGLAIVVGQTRAAQGATSSPAMASASRAPMTMSGDGYLERRSSCISTRCQAALRGTEALYGHADSKAWANQLQPKMVALYGRAGQQDRGHVSVSQLHPSTLIEPFFGDNPSDATFGAENKDGLADAVLSAFALLEGHTLPAPDAQPTRDETGDVADGLPDVPLLRELTAASSDDPVACMAQVEDDARLAEFRRAEDLILAAINARYGRGTWDFRWTWMLPCVQSQTQAPDIAHVSVEANQLLQNGRLGGGVQHSHPIDPQDFQLNECARARGATDGRIGAVAHRKCNNMKRGTRALPTSGRPHRSSVSQRAKCRMQHE